MNIMSMESIFLVLSGVILFAGIMYWLWSHIQLTQKKVQLLENAVFELRGMMTPGAPPPSSATSSPSPSPSPAYEDLPDDGWEEEQEDVDMSQVRSTPLEHIGGHDEHSMVVEREEYPQAVNDDLMPGAPALNVMEKEGETPAEDFRELFVAQETASPVRTPESLDSMPVKELRRLAEQRGIVGAADMRKKEILAALRKQVSPAGEVAVQKTLDLNIEEVSESVHVEEEILE